MAGVLCTTANDPAEMTLRVNFCRAILQNARLLYPSNTGHEGERSARPFRANKRQFDICVIGSLGPTG